MLNHKSDNYSPFMNELVASGNTRTYDFSLIVAKSIADEVALTEGATPSDEAHKLLDYVGDRLPLDWAVCKELIGRCYTHRLDVAYPKVTPVKESACDKYWLHGGTRTLSKDDFKILRGKSAHSTYNKLRNYIKEK